MKLGLEGRRALVAGSSGGIGATIARTLASEGAAVIIHGRDGTKAEAVAADIRASGASASVLLGCLDEPAEIDRLAGEALASGPMTFSSIAKVRRGRSSAGSTLRSRSGSASISARRCTPCS